MVDCVFVSVPASCLWQGESCRATESHLLDCATNHRRLRLAEGGRALLLEIFQRTVLDTGRVKGVSGQAGRVEG
ncbi:hypothetical protein LCGC14_2021780 [marine sediment metagenome]|uniref:Uncharacterized protein n=1 Tax=marine sediment metagenome TaxID=412755 RepID=A0A0F9HAN6_9ZZZZ